ncbi:MAG: GerMN domain-containing protein [Lachnospiraceae bacterium]|nr:GerMN domain-containing protein [Lachnospiraceae bacterium]
MNKWQWKKCIGFSVLCLALLCGCSSKAMEENSLEETEEIEGAVKLYYLNEEQTKVISKDLEPAQATIEEQVSELLTELEEVLWTEEEKRRLLEQNPIYEYKIDEKGLVSLRFPSDYDASQSITEALRRAAIVKTLCQVESIMAVEFYIGTQPLLTSGGKPVGMLNAEDFIDSTGENTEFYQEAKVAVYFANEFGNALVESNLKITYDGTVSTEQLVLEQLMEGPVVDDMQPVIPVGTVLNKVTVKDGICYVDFNEKFMEKREAITAEVAVYSIVNSLTELSNVYKVQFLINGEPRKNYQNLDFSLAFERNLEIIEGEQ